MHTSPRPSNFASAPPPTGQCSLARRYLLCSLCQRGLSEFLTLSSDRLKIYCMDLKLLPVKEQRPTSRANLTRRARCKAAAFSKVLPGRDPLIDCFAYDWLFCSLRASDIIPCMDSNPLPIDVDRGDQLCFFRMCFPAFHATRGQPQPIGYV
jgi:hypothetical protein